MRRKLLTAALLLIVVGVLWVYTSMPCLTADGGFHLTVRVSSNPGPPQAVSCEACSSRKHAEYAMEHLLLPETRWSATADPFTGEPLTVRVPISVRYSRSGRELSHFQFQYLVVVAVLPDGRRVGKVVDIPGGQVSREVNVELP
jgi:hypothetical protein